MNLIEFYRLEQKRLHETLRASVSDLSVDEWHFNAGGTSGSIAFLLWHCIRTEDNVLHLVLQGNKPIWSEGNWHERLGLPPRAQGTGMTTQEAQEFQISDPALFMRYAEQVWSEFESYLADITDGGAELSERMVMVKPLGNMPAIQVIGQVCISHLFVHSGEIAALLGIQGKKGLPI